MPMKKHSIEAYSISTAECTRRFHTFPPSLSKSVQLDVTLIPPKIVCNRIKATRKGRRTVLENA